MRSTKFNAEFHFNDLSLSEQDRLYNQLYNILDDDLKNKLSMCIVDEAGGKHYINDSIGKRPDDIICRECYEIDCAACTIWRKEHPEYND